MGHYMTKEERIIMQTLLDEKKPVSYIARKLGCCRQTVYNEIRRGQYLHNYGYSLNLEMTSSTLEMALSNSRTMKPISLPAKVPSLENTLTTSCEMELLL